MQDPEALLHPLIVIEQFGSTARYRPRRDQLTRLETRGTLSQLFSILEFDLTITLWQHTTPQQKHKAIYSPK
jgi:hypothetical protein